MTILPDMVNSSSPSNVYASYSSTLNGTINNTSCPSSETDYTVYFKLASVLLFVIATTLVSGFATLARAIRSLRPAAQDRRCSGCRSQVQDVEELSTSMFDKHDVREKAPEVDPAGLALPQAAKLSDHNAWREIPYLSSPQHHPSSPPSREKKGRKLWKRARTVVSNSGWATHAMNAAAVAVGCVLGGPPSIQYNLPTPATEPGRPY